MKPNTKICGSCGIKKPASEFWPLRRTTKDGLSWNCKSCKRIANNEYNLRVKMQTIQAYGGECSCCGESRQEFLSIDHINGGGNKKRAAGEGTGAILYTKLRRLGFPKDEYRLLCHNCNLALGFFGRCPHKEVAISRGISIEAINA